MRLHFSLVLPLGLTLALLAGPAFAQPRAPRLDYYGDPLPPGAEVRLGTKRFQTKGGFGWTPDGKSLATFRGGTVYFWDLEDGHCRETLLVPINPDPFFTHGTKFVLSQDGQKLVCADFNGGLATWDLATSQMASLPGGTSRHEENMGVALHPGGKHFVTLRQSGEIQLRDFATCQIARTITPKPPARWNQNAVAAFSPDGRTLVLHAGSGTTIRLVDVDKGEELPAIQKAHSYSLDHLEFIVDGRLFTVGAKREADATEKKSQNQLLIWDVSVSPPTSREIPVGDDYPLAGTSASFSVDGKTLITIHNDRLVIWDLAGRKPARTIQTGKFRNPMDAVVKIDPTGKYVGVDDRQNYVRIWELASGQPVLSTERHHQAGVYGLDWSPSGQRIATGDFTGEGRIWDAASGKPLASFRGTDWGAFALRYTRDGTQVVICGDEPAAGPPKVAGRITGPVRWHDAENGKQIRETVLASRARLLTPSPDGSQWAVITIAIDEDAATPPPAIRVLDAKTGAETTHFEIERDEADEPDALAWSADGKSLLVALNKKVVQFDAATGKVLAEVELPHFYLHPATKLLVQSGIGRAAFLGHGAEIVTSGRGELYGWRLPAGEKRWTTPCDDWDVRLLTVSRDERLLAVASMAENRSAKLRLFDLGTRRLVATFDLGRDSAERAVFSPNGNRILVGCIDGTALVYDVSDVE